MKANELFCKMWDAPYIHGEKYSGSYAVWIEENTLYISFQQTVRKQDWKQSFKLQSIKLEYGDLKGVEVHLGFFQQYFEVISSLLDKVLNELKENPQVDSVVICGWSQGAVLASLCYKIFANTVKKSDKENYISHKCVLFGMPNFIKKRSLEKWRNLPCGNVIEFQHACDLFSYLPLGYTKPKTQKIILGKRFNIFKAIFEIRKYHTSYIDFENAQNTNREI